MNKFLVAFTFTAALLGLNTQPAQDGQHLNFYPTVKLDTAQVAAPAPLTASDFVCWTSAEYPDFSCMPALKADPRIFSDPRITDIQLVNLNDKEN